MQNLGLNQILWLWSELEAAFYGKNGFGGDTAEIYIYRLMGNVPNVFGDERDEALAQLSARGESIREAYDRANASLYAVLAHFAETREALIEIDGRELGDWLKTERFTHRVHVRVKACERRGD